MTDLAVRDNPRIREQMTAKNYAGCGPFRLFSVSSPIGCCRPQITARTLQRDCTPLRPSCWSLHFVGKSSLAPLVRPWLGRLATLASLRLSLALLGFGSGYACLGYAPPARLCRRSTSARCYARSARSFLRFTPKRKAVFSRKRSVQGNAHFSRK